MISLIIHVLISALGFWIVSRIVPGWRIKDFSTAVMVALVYGFLSFLAVWPKLIAIIASLPFMILFPVWLISAIINFTFSVALLMITDKLVEDFEIDNAATAVVGSVVLTVVMAFLRLLL